MSTVISAAGQFAGRPAATVGFEVPAAALMPADLFLVEQHVVRGICTRTREVVAIVVRSRVTGDGLAVIDWAGAVPGEHVSTGTAVYETSSPVTVLALQQGTAAAA